jgi:hypothetical protein
LAPDLPLASEFAAIPSTNPDTVNQFGILRERQSVTPAIVAIIVARIHGASFSTSDFFGNQQLVEYERKMSCQDFANGALPSFPSGKRTGADYGRIFT